MKPKHTELPWKIVEEEDSFTHIKSADGNRSICGFGDMENMDGEDLRNIEFITRACNNHYKLLTAIIALQQAYRVLGEKYALDCGLPEVPTPFEVDNVEALALKAIADAKTKVDTNGNISL